MRISRIRKKIQISIYFADIFVGRLVGNVLQVLKNICHVHCCDFTTKRIFRGRRTKKRTNYRGQV